MHTYVHTPNIYVWHWQIWHGPTIFIVFSCILCMYHVYTWSKFPEKFKVEMNLKPTNHLGNHYLFPAWVNNCCQLKLLGTHVKINVCRHKIAVFEKEPQSVLLSVFSWEHLEQAITMQRSRSWMRSTMSSMPGRWGSRRRDKSASWSTAAAAAWDIRLLQVCEISRDWLRKRSD